jgi:hypothetical protein
MLYHEQIKQFPLYFFELICARSPPASGDWLVRKELASDWSRRVCKFVTKLVPRLKEVETCSGPRHTKKNNKYYFIF